MVLAVVAMVVLVLPAAAKKFLPQLPDPDGKEPDTSKPVRVYILTGQSDMLHMGNISAGESGARIYRDSDKPDTRRAVNVSLYKGKYSPEKDYDKMEPVVTELFNVLGGCRDAKTAEQLSTVDGDFTRIATGFLEVPQTGTYSFYPGNRTNSIMTVDGKETYRKEPSKEEMTKTYIKLEAKKKYPFKAVSLDGQISPHWRYHRKDTPGTLNMLVKEKGKFPYLLGKDGGKQEWTDEYESKLVNLIKDVRAEFNVPKLPVVVATVAFGGREMKGRYLQILEAQMAVSDPAKYPELAGNVLSVDTQDFWRSKEVSPNQTLFSKYRNLRARR